MDTSLVDKVAAIPFWYHRIELPGGIVTPGGAPMIPERYGVPEDLTGLRVLDVGAWDGYWTFEALKRGAREVIAIDDFSDQIGMDVQREKWRTFDLCRDAFGYGTDRVTRFEMSVYDVTPERLGTFDVVFFFGTLYHLRHPLLALDKLSAVCYQTIYIETAILDDYSPYRGLGKGYDGGQMVMEFYPDNQYGNNHTNWWVPTGMCLMHMVRAAGFEHVDVWKLMDNPTRPPEFRGFARGIKPGFARPEG
jgi:tRNA (mo5U34)-methyltransferase